MIFLTCLGAWLLFGLLFAAWLIFTSKEKTKAWQTSLDAFNDLCWTTGIDKRLGAILIIIAVAICWPYIWFTGMMKGRKG